MQTFVQKPKSAHSIAMPARARLGQSNELNTIHQLQRVVGNQAVQRMLHTKPGQFQLRPLLQRDEQTPASCDDREPRDEGVKKIVEDALGGSRSTTYPVRDLQTAWFNVRNQREKGGANCCNPELAAAEHYLYARYAVANRDHSPVEMKALIWGYGYLKFLVPKTGNCPKSPDTQGSRDWGYRGVDDGANDLFHQELAQNDNGQAQEGQAQEGQPAEVAV